MKQVGVATHQVLALTVRQREWVAGVLDEIPADGEEGPRRAVEILGAVTAEIAGNLPAVDPFTHVGLFGTDRLLRGGDSVLDGLAHVGCESIQIEGYAGRDANLCDALKRWGIVLARRVADHERVQTGKELLRRHREDLLRWWGLRIDPGLHGNVRGRRVLRSPFGERSELVAVLRLVNVSEVGFPAV